MPTLRCEVDRRGGLTLVECIVRNDTAERRRVRVENRLDGPVRAPEGPTTPTGWTDGTATLTLAPGEACALGYASPAPPQEPPVALEDSTLERGDGAVAGVGDAAPAVPAPRPPTDDACDDGDEGGSAGPLRPDGAGVAPEPGVPLPPAVATWLSALEDRVETLEAGERADATPGHPTVVVDRETLAALERRAADLGDRLAAISHSESDISMNKE
jgi:hypothetical protein